MQITKSNVLTRPPKVNRSTFHEAPLTRVSWTMPDKPSLSPQSVSRQAASTANGRQRMLHVSGRCAQASWAHAHSIGYDQPY